MKSIKEQAGLGSRASAACMPQDIQSFIILKISWKSKPFFLNVFKATKRV